VLALASRLLSVPGLHLLPVQVLPVQVLPVLPMQVQLPVPASL
jgi:hypothetical protein